MIVKILTVLLKMCHNITRIMSCSVPFIFQHHLSASTAILSINLNVSIKVMWSEHMAM